MEIGRPFSDGSGLALATMGGEERSLPVNLLAWIIVGLIGGVLAKMLVPGRGPAGILLTILLGIAGALVGGFISVGLGIGNGVDDFDIGTIVLSVLGAVLILIGYNMVTNDRGGIRA